MKEPGTSLALHVQHFLAQNSEKSSTPGCFEGIFAKVGCQNIMSSCITL